MFLQSGALFASLTKNGRSLHPFELEGNELITLYLVVFDDIFAFTGRVEKEILLNSQIGYASLVIYLFQDNGEVVVGDVHVHPVMRLFLRLVPCDVDEDAPEDVFYYRSQVALMTEGAL